MIDDYKGASAGESPPPLNEESVPDEVNDEPALADPAGDEVASETVDDEWVEWASRRVIFNSRKEIESRVPTVMHLGPASGAAVEAQLRSRAALDDEPLTHKGRIYSNGHLYFGGVHLPISWGDPRGAHPPVFEVRYRLIDGSQLPVRSSRSAGSRPDLEALRREVAELGEAVDEQNVALDALRAEVEALREAVRGDPPDSATE